MNKRIKLILIVLVILISSTIIYITYNYFRIKNAKIEVELKDDLVLEFNDKKHVSDFIEKINGKISNDYIIDSTKLGNKNIKFSFTNNDGIKVKYAFKIKVVDTIAPVIWLGNNYNLEKGSDVVLTDKILCGDNYDNKPNCFIEGDYDINTPGTYPLTFKAIDSSGNAESKSFNLNVYEPIKTETKEDNKIEKSYTYFTDIVNNYKNDKTKIGLDISSWQGDVDFKKIKDAGVEFVIIRVGGTRGTNGKYFLDSKFERNIKEANKYDIDVGIYFYSYANSIKKAKKDAEWVLKQIKKYDVSLPIAFDWEEWAYFNEYNLSFFGLTSMADSFLKTIENHGYKGMLYSSKAYLDMIWMPLDYDIWLAHYTSKTNYEGKFKFWQLCDNGKVDGIDTDVDIDIMYK
jgi:lysozyme